MQPRPGRRDTSTLVGAPTAAVPAFLQVLETSIEADWLSTNPPGTIYEMEASSTSFAANTNIESSTTLNTQTLLTSLLVNTTYEFRASEFLKLHQFSLSHLFARGMETFS